MKIGLNIVAAGPRVKHWYNEPPESHLNDVIKLPGCYYGELEHISYVSIFIF